METTKKTTRKPASKTPVGERIRSAYQEYLLTNGKRPVSVFKFCLDLGIKEDDFYNHFGSFDGLERDIWNGFLEKTINRLKADESFGNFSAREKILALYYTLVEELKLNRSFVLFQLGKINKPELTPGYLKTFKSTFEIFIENILAAGQESGEIAKRPFFDKQYPRLFWLHLGFILLFWKDDESAAFEKTDAAIEKSVNLAFDLIGKGTVDSVIDFGKFLYQNKIR